MSDITISKADLKSRDQKITDQQQRIADLERRLEESGSGGQNTSASANFSKDDQDLLGELAGPIERLITGALTGVTSKLEPTLTQLSSSMSSLQEQVKNQNQSLFSGVASSTLQNYDQVKDTDEFKALLEKRIPGMNVTYGDSWADAQERNSFREMQEIINMVDISSDNTEEHGGESNFEPTGGSSVEEQRMTSQFKYKASDLTQKMNEYKTGSITIDEFEEFEKSFNEAVDRSEVLNDLEET